MTYPCGYEAHNIPSKRLASTMFVGKPEDSTLREHFASLITNLTVASGKVVLNRSNCAIIPVVLKVNYAYP